MNSVKSVNSVNSVNRVNHVNSVNSVNSVRSLSLMVFLNSNAITLSGWRNFSLAQPHGSNVQIFQKVQKVNTASILPTLEFPRKVEILLLMGQMANCFLGWWTVLSKRSKNQYPVEWKSIYGGKAMIRGRSSFTSSSRVKDVANRLNLEKKSNEDSPALVHWTLSWSLGLWARLLSALQQGIFRDEVEDWRTSWWR